MLTDIIIVGSNPYYLAALFPLLHADCPPGSFAVGWGCHICPEGSYKDASGPESCAPCSKGLVTSQGAALKGRVLSAHDEAADCRVGELLCLQITCARAALSSRLDKEKAI
jgi:hypothetical protein